MFQNAYVKTIFTLALSVGFNLTLLSNESKATFIEAVFIPDGYDLRVTWTLPGHIEFVGAEWTYCREEPGYIPQQIEDGTCFDVMGIQTISASALNNVVWLVEPGTDINGNVATDLKEEFVNLDTGQVDPTLSVKKDCLVSNIGPQNIESQSTLWNWSPIKVCADNTQISWKIPKLLDNSLTTLYTAVNLEVYTNQNPLGFNNGNWSIGQTLSDLSLEITNGQIPGLEGIYWSTTPFISDLNSSTGFAPSGGVGNLYNSGSGVNTLIVSSNDLYKVPEPTSALSILALGTLGAASTLKRKQKLSKSTAKETTKVG